MKELEPTRNVLCHMNPLDANNTKALQVQVERWSKLVKRAGSALDDTVTLRIPVAMTVTQTA